MDLQPAGHAGRGRPGGGGCFAATRSSSPPSNNGDKLCVARQLRLPVQEVLSDFDAITGIGSRWREQGITPREIRSFCVWRQAPMFYVDCQGRLLDKYEPAIKEQRARVAFTSWNGHAFFYKSARTVARCEPIGDRAQAKYRGERKPGETPEFKDWPRRTAPRWSCGA